MAKPPARFQPLLEVFRPDDDEWAGVLIEPLCARGEIICWARRGGRDGPWHEVPAESWAAGLRVIDQNLLYRDELRDERVRTRKEGRTVIELRERPAVVEQWHDPRFALADTDPAPRSPAWRRQVGDWFAREFVPVLKSRRVPRDELIAMVQARWPEASKRLIEDLKKKHSKDLPRRLGRPPKKSNPLK